MRYNEKIQLKLYEYDGTQFVLQAIIDDYESCSFERNYYKAGQFTITINYNIPNALLFQRGLFVQFGSDKYDFGEIYAITDSIGADGKGSQKRVITGYDARYLFKRRIIANLNANENWTMTAKGELCMRNLIADQCGANAETIRRLPIGNTIPTVDNALGSVYTVAESYSNLYEVLATIATQSGIGWRIKFDGNLTLECYAGEDLTDSVFFSTDFDSLANGNFADSADNYTNAVYVGGKGSGNERDIYVGEDMTGERIIVGSENTFLVDENENYIVVALESPGVLDRFESWDDKSELSTEEEYTTEAQSILNQYMQNISVSGAGLAKCPYIYKEQYNVGDYIKLSFSGKSANVQIQSVTENWQRGNYGLTFAFGKPVNSLADQLQLMLRKIQTKKTTETVTSVKWYETPTDTAQAFSEVTCDTLGFTGAGGTFRLYLDDEEVGSKNYNIYGKNLAGALTLVTEQGGSLALPAGNFVTRIYVDTDGNILKYS